MLCPVILVSKNKNKNGTERLLRSVFCVQEWSKVAKYVPASMTANAAR
jgi:hypothetical protein